MKKLLSQSSSVVCVGSSRLLAATAFLAIGISMTPEEGRGQTIACEDLVADMAAQQHMIGIFKKFDDDTRNHFLIVANAILSTYGGWNSKGEGWATNASNLQASTGNFELQAAVIRRDIGRSIAITEEELQRLNSSIDRFLELVALGDKIAVEIDGGRVDEANQIYFEAARTNYVSIHGDLYTLIIAAERRVASMARTPCN